MITANGFTAQLLKKPMEGAIYHMGKVYIQEGTIAREGEGMDGFVTPDGNVLLSMEECPAYVRKAVGVSFKGSPRIPSVVRKIYTEWKFDHLVPAFKRKVVDGIYWWTMWLRTKDGCRFRREVAANG